MTRHNEKRGATKRPREISACDHGQGNGAHPEVQAAEELQTELDLDLVQHRRLDWVRPAPENEDIYKAIAIDDPANLELARSIQAHGIQEPLLISRDGFIISGHRRRIAAALAFIR